ncbi:MAG TPA: AMP-binding protein, partial [Desulfomonilia bacterium]|nr:AMP-binding protein [Desulfomonilia bacterium]
MNYNEKPWLSSYTAGVPEKITFEELCIPDFLEKAAREFPKNMALSFMGYTLTYVQLKDMVDRFATCLTDFGIKKGDSVAILLPNTIQCVVAYHSILKIGGIAVMNNPLYSDKELLHQFNDSGAKTLVTIDLLANRMIDLRPQTVIKQIVVASISDYLPVPATDFKPAESVFRW